MPKVKQKQTEIDGKGKKFVAGNTGHGGKTNLLITTKPAVLPPEAPVANVPKNAKLTDDKQWCLRNTQVLRAVVDRWTLRDKVKVPLSSVVQDSHSLNKHKVVNILEQKHSSTWSAVRYESVAIELTDEIKRTRERVTTRVTGWVQNAHLDKFSSAYPDSEVDIPNATPLSTDPQQYMTLEIDEEEKKFKHVIRHNMCGEISVAFTAKKDVDTVLTDWKAKPGSFFKDRLGMGKDKTLNPAHIKDILDLYFPSEDGRSVEPYVDLEGRKIQLTATGVPWRASDEFQRKLKTHDFITLVRINLTTGELIPLVSVSDRNHWVVVTRTMRGGSRVELYNPFPNRRQPYTFSAFIAATGSNVNSGWWVQRKKSVADRPFSEPDFGVGTNNPTFSTIDAEQYVFIEGGSQAKTRLCGEFCTAHIINSSINTSLENWTKRQETRPAGLWETTNMLDAYGFNNKDGKRWFSIDTLLRYWKKIQPNLYASTVGGETNEGTDILDLMSILRAYGYKPADMSLIRPGDESKPAESFLFSPDRDARALKKYHLIVGVIIHGRTGRLKDRASGGVEHWVVVNSMSPEGNQYGGGGGWVEIYNPFPNCWEEYTLSELARSFNGGTLWVKRNITPVFTPETPQPPKVKVKPGIVVKAGKGGKATAAATPTFGLLEIIKEFNRLMNQPNPVLGDVLRKLAKLSGLDPNQIRKVVGAGKDASKPDVDVEKSLCAILGVKSIPEVVSRWIAEKARGDEIHALQLADTLRRVGILIVNDKECSMVDLAKFRSSDKAIAAPQKQPAESLTVVPDRNTRLLQSGEQITLQAAGKAARPFVSMAVGELKSTFKKISEAGAANLLISRVKPVHALKPRDEYLEWIRRVEKADPAGLYRVRIWGDPVMMPMGFDVNDPDVPEDAVKGVGHFQAVGLYNNLNGEFGAISNHIDIKRDDIDNLIEMQVEEVFNGKLIARKQKMNWLCSHRGKIFMYDDKSDKWETAQRIRWGTLALGGNLVQIERFDEIEAKLPGDRKKKVHRMGRLVGFRKKDWTRPLDVLLAEGLVHRCFCVYKNNGFGDVPNKGVVFSPLFSPQDKAWTFNGNKRLDALYIPEVYLEKKGK